MIEDDQDHFEINEIWHGWYWYRFLLGHAMLSDAVQMMDDYPDAEKMEDFPGDLQVFCSMAIETAMGQQAIIGTMGCDLKTEYR